MNGCSEAQKALIFKTLQEAIEVGAPLYNNGKIAACYQIYEGAAADLTQRLAVSCVGPKRALSDGRRRAAKLDDPSAQAWAMRDSFDGMLEARSSARRALTGAARRPRRGLDTSPAAPSASSRCAAMSTPNMPLLRNLRAQIIEHLTQRLHARRGLGLEEFEERLNGAYAAAATSELGALVADLSPERPPCSRRNWWLRRAQGWRWPMQAAGRAVSAAVAILGSVERRGHWAVARSSGALAVLGSVVIDLRDVTLPPGVTTLQVSAVLGSIEILVPPQLAVESDGSGILGSFDGIHTCRTNRTQLCRCYGCKGAQCLAASKSSRARPIPAWHVGHCAEKPRRASGHAEAELQVCSSAPTPAQGLSSM